MTLAIPKEPNVLDLLVEREWNGEACEDDRLKARIELSQTRDGLKIRAEMPELHEQKVPEAPKASRVDGLWDYDVVEVFLVGPGHRYLEVELGAGGHWLVLGFDSIRERSHDYADFNPHFRFKKTDRKSWVSEIVIPWTMVPENLRALNAFIIAAGRFLSLSPVPGAEPDFHQPDLYPSARLA